MNNLSSSSSTSDVMSKVCYCCTLYSLFAVMAKYVPQPPKRYNPAINCTVEARVFLVCASVSAAGNTEEDTVFLFTAKGSEAD